MTPSRRRRSGDGGLYQMRDKLHNLVARHPQSPPKRVSTDVRVLSESTLSESTLSKPMPPPIRVHQYAFRLMSRSMAPMRMHFRDNVFGVERTRIRRAPQTNRHARQEALRRIKLIRAILRIRRAQPKMRAPRRKIPFEMRNRVPITKRKPRSERRGPSHSL